MSAITDRHRSVCQLRSVHRRWASAVADAVAERLSSALAPGERLRDLELSADLAIRLLGRSWHDLSSADEAMTTATDRLATLVTTRDAALTRLYRELSDLRTRLRGRLGRNVSSGWLGLTGDTSRDPVVLLRQADRATHRLATGTSLLPEGVEPPTSEQRRRWAKPVASAADDLRPVLDAADRAAHHLDAARLERQRALSAFNDTFVETATWLAATYRFAGRDDLAEAVRPSGWLKGRTHRIAQKQRADVEAQNPEPATPTPAKAIEPASAQPERPLRRLITFFEKRAS